jgi:predicted DNA-binding transcriptional regulator AlpA
MPKEISLVALAAEIERLKELISTPRLHRSDVMLRYGISEPTLHRWMRLGRLPRPRRVTGPIWSLADLEAAERAGRVPEPAG